MSVRLGIIIKVPVPLIEKSRASCPVTQTHREIAQNTSNKRTAPVLGILNVCLLAILPNEGLRTFLRGVASSVM